MIFASAQKLKKRSTKRTTNSRSRIDQSLHMLLALIKFFILPSTRTMFCSVRSMSLFRLSSILFCSLASAPKFSASNRVACTTPITSSNWLSDCSRCYRCCLSSSWFVLPLVVSNSPSSVLSLLMPVSISLD